MSKNIVFDFDGVIHSYKSGWQGADVISDPPVEGIREAINDIRKAGYKVYVVSSRCSSSIGITSVQEWLVKYSIYVDGVCQEKPPAVAYIDDRAICFDGDSKSLLEKIENFEPWYNKKIQ